jgi:hypothetical protein
MYSSAARLTTVNSDLTDSLVTCRTVSGGAVSDGIDSGVWRCL